MARSKSAFDFIKTSLFLIVLGALLGGFSGLVTLGFIKLMEWLQHLIWTSLPSWFGLSPKHAVYTVIACTLGGVLVGCGVKWLGNYPDGITETLAEVKKGKPFDFKHIPQTIANSLISLGFGAALGPEAALTSIVGGLSTWISKKLKFIQTEVDSISISAVLGSIFGTPLGSAAVVVDKTKSIAIKLQIFLSGLVAALAGWWIFQLGSSGGSYFDLNILPYSFVSRDLLYAILPAALGCVLGMVFLQLNAQLPKLIKPIKDPIARANFGGLLFGLLAIALPLMLFSGHEGTQALMTSYTSATAGLLILVALGKSFAANLLLATGWKGGQFFPVMFAGAAIGLGFTQLVDVVPAMVGLVAGMTAMLAMTLKKPLVAGLFVSFFFPAKLYGIILMAVIVSLLLLRLQKTNHQTHSK